MPQKRADPTLHDDIAEAINQHVTIEAESAFMYYAMASWANVRGLTGFAKWFNSEGDDEIGHMHQFVQYLGDHGYQATFGTIAPAVQEWADPIKAIEDAVAAEHRLCEQIDRLIELTHKHRDHLTESFLHRFVPVQIGDRSKADGILDRLRITKGEGHGLLLIDQELSVSAGTA